MWVQYTIYNARTRKFPELRYYTMHVGTAIGVCACACVCSSMYSGKWMEHTAFMHEYIIHNACS